MIKITDPDVLKRLNAGEFDQPKKITDPDVLKRLNAGEFDQPNETKEKETPRSQDKVDVDNIIRYGATDPVIALFKLQHAVRNVPRNIAGLFSESLANKIGGPPDIDYGSVLGLPESEQNTVDSAIQSAPEMLASLLAPETKLGKVGDIIDKLPGWGKYLKTGLGNAISQGGLAAAQSSEPGQAALEAGSIAAPFSALGLARESGSPTLRSISRALGTIGAGGLGYFGAKSAGAPEPAADLAALLSGALGSRGGNVERRARENMLTGVEGTDYQDVVNAGKRIGVHVRPGEASNNPFVSAKEATIGKSAKGAQIFHEEGEKRLDQEEKSIGNLFENIFPKSLEDQKNKLYESAKPVEIPEKDLQKLKENKIFKKATKEVDTDPVHQEALKGSSKNSINYLNQVKIEMDKMMFGEPKGKAKTIKAVKDELTNISDKASPDYREGRQLAERGIVRREIEDLFNKKDETGTNLFKTVLSNKRDYKDLQNKFKRLEETASTEEQVKSMKSAQQQLEDMKLVFGRLIETPSTKNAVSLARQNNAKEGSLTTMAKDYFKKLLHSDKYDVAAVKLITDPKWAEQVGKLNEITDKDKLMGAFYKLIGKAGAQAVAQ